ncbi:MAG: hypothetical protein U0R79_03010 [Propionicimonas sp.]
MLGFSAMAVPSGKPTSELTRVAAEAFLKDVMKNYQTLAQR